MNYVVFKRQHPTGRQFHALSGRLKTNPAGESLDRYAALRPMLHKPAARFYRHQHHAKIRILYQRLCCVA